MESFEQERGRVLAKLAQFRNALVDRQPFGPAIICTTGSRQGPTQAQQDMWEHMRSSLSKILMHNGCADGWDRYAALSIAATKELWPSNREQEEWARATFRGGYETHAIRPPLLRNRLMVNYSNGVIAAPIQSAEVRRSGTWATIRYAREFKKPVLIIWPNGEIVFDGSLADGTE